MRQRPLHERDEKLSAVQGQLAASVEALVSDRDWQQAMAFATRFRSRSFNNTLLISAQHHSAYLAGRVPEPSPTYVAGYRQWLTLGRQVARGQAGYAILAPVTGRYASTTPTREESWRRLRRGEKPRPGEVVRSRLIGLRAAYVWDLSQTTGPPIPRPPAPVLLTGQAPEGLWDGLAAQTIAQDFRLAEAPSAAELGGANGLTDFSTRTVTIRTDMDEAARTKTLAHELGHILMHGPDNPDGTRHRGIAEVEAESVALMVAAAHGLDTSGYTIPYVSTWAASVPDKSPVEVVQGTAERVRATAVRILDQLSTTQIGNGDPPGLDRSPSPAATDEPSRTRSLAHSQAVSL